MAKKKSVESGDSNTKDDIVFNDIIKTYGESIMRSGKDIVNNPGEIISLSPKLDIILGGGIPGGSFVVFGGKAKSGKSISALTLCGHAQKLGRKTYYLNIEGRLKSRDIAGIKCLNPDELIVIGSIPGKILTAQDYLSIARNIVLNEPRAIVVLDSVSQLATEKELSSQTGETGRNNQGTLLGEFCRQISNTLPVNDCIVVAITHTIANTSGFGSPFAETGGNKIKYAVDVKLYAKSFEPWKAKATDEEPIGQTVTWESQTTALNIAPGKKMLSKIRYGIGIDETAELIDLGLSLGIINQGGAWYDYKTIKAQGQEKLWMEFENNQEIRNILHTEIKEMLI